MSIPVLTTGVRQGCILSPTLFPIVMDLIVRSVDGKKGTQLNPFEHLEDLEYADNICLMSHKYKHLQAKTEALNITSKLVGLQINTKKTKIMAINNRRKPMKIQNEETENVEEFTYLGSIVDKNGDTEKDIKSRISKAQIAFQSLRKIWQSNNLSLRTKLRLFNTNVKSVLLYGAETWKTTKNLTNKIQAFINRCLRRILKIHWPEKISNEELYRKTNQEPVKKTIKYHK
jgi:hypothetical protein